MDVRGPGQGSVIDNRPLPVQTPFTTMSGQYQEGLSRENQSFLTSGVTHAEQPINAPELIEDYRLPFSPGTGHPFSTSSTNIHTDGIRPHSVDGLRPSEQGDEDLATAISWDSNTIAHRVQTDVFPAFASIHGSLQPTPAAPMTQITGSDRAIEIDGVHSPALSPFRPAVDPSDLVQRVAGAAHSPPPSWPVLAPLQTEPAHGEQFARARESVSLSEELVDDEQ